MHYDKLPFYDLSLRIRQARRIEKLPIGMSCIYIENEVSPTTQPTTNRPKLPPQPYVHSGSKWLKSAKNKFA